MTPKNQSFRGYNGNPNLKSMNTPHEWTKEQVEEYVKCAEDPIYFIERYIKIISLDLGEVLMELFDYQKEIILSLKENRKTAAVICRQAGKTTVLAAFIVWYVNFHDSKTVAILANKAATAREILSRVQFAYERLPGWLQNGVVEWNKGSFLLENNSRCLASSTSSSAIRGFSVNFLMLDEFAFVPDTVADEFFASVYPTIASSKSSKIAVISTPNGMNHFHKIVKEAEEGINGFNLTKAIWSDVPGRDAKWKQDMIVTLGEEEFSQEMECEFLGSSNTLLRSATVKHLINIANASPLKSSGAIRIYEEPVADAQYVATVDTSRGVGSDNSVISIFSVSSLPYKLVAQYVSNTTSYAEMPGIIVEMCKTYNSCFALVEANDLGEVVAKDLYFSHEYENVFYSQKNSITYNTRDTSGLKTTTHTKSIGCSTLKLLLENGQLEVNDYDTIQELTQFVKSKGSYAAAAGKKDDRVMTLVLFAYLTTQDVFSDITKASGVNKIVEMRKNQIDEDLLPLGYSTNMEDFDYL